MAYGKSIELFLVNGTADSLIIAELSNWNGKAIKIPRIEVSACNRDDISQAGVYFLFCKEDDGSDSVYIGEAENVKDRLVQHLRDYQSEKEKYYWSTAVVFIGRDLNKALIRYLENRFVEIARASKRYVVKQTTWNEACIVTRANLLADKAIEIWKYPVLTEDELKPYTTPQKAAVGYNIDSYDLNDVTRELFDVLDRRIQNVGAGVKREFKKLYTVTVLSRDTVTFDLKCGLRLKERLVKA